ncbi:clostripain-related cysteine peptidase [uncultured Bacteroides sp.]|uniref:clostripain-related cysteine peptidase n=1 Tax=uncultured Bacteroides sp. TaxID=162156 RepID=UPI00259AADD4|nr:clostripain-related cysteine peptidase [uncultured Bacteroides sp.]
MRKILFLLLSVFVFTACSDEIPEEKIPVKSGRTILSYLISNNSSGNLDRNLKQNLVDMYSGLAETTDSCTLLVYYRPYENDADGLEGPTILKYNSDGNGNINGRPSLTGGDLNAGRVIQESDGISCFKEEQNHISTSPETMKRILGLMVNMSPSQSYGLVFGSHGTSWMPGNTVKGRSFGDDDGYNINIPEMSDVLEEVFSGKQLDFILFDACMMATAEVCYEFKDVTDYLIGAVVETHVYGHPYDIVLPKLYEKNVPYDEVCDDYIDYSRQLGAWGTCAAVDCSKMDDLAEWVGANLEVYSDKFASLDKDAIQQYGVNDEWRNFKYFSFDIVDCFKNLNDGDTPEGLENVMNKVVVAKDALYGIQYPIVDNSLYTIDEDRFCGIGMYLPNLVTKSSWNSYYKTLSWYKAVGWDRF